MSDKVSNLQPFTRENAAEMGRRGGLKRAEKAAARKAASVPDLDGVLLVLDRFNRDELGPRAAACAGLVIARVAAGEVPVRHAGDAAALVTALVDVARLEAGEATSHVIAARVNVDATADRVRALQEQARQALASGAASTAPEHEGSGS